jgi:hypothetical protein
VRYFVASLVLLIPCFWLPRIHAGDLASHAYNAWLANEVKAGRGSGLVLVHQWSNVLFDHMLAQLMPLIGADWSQRIAVAICVLIFFWGLFVWIQSQSRSAWTISPVLMMLAYGRIFHMGFFNFYLAMGLGFLSLGLVRAQRAAPTVWAIALLALSIFAHVLGTAIVLMIAFVLWLARRTRLNIFAFGTATLAALILSVQFWFPQLFITEPFKISPAAFGLTQFLLYGPIFFIITIALYTVLAMKFVFDAETLGFAPKFAMKESLLLCFSVLFAAVTPWAVFLPGVANALSYLDLRAGFVVTTALLLCVTNGRFHFTLWATLAIVALFYFASLHIQLHKLDKLESQITTVVRTVPSGSRVVSSLRMRASGFDPLEHMIDRACIGHCYSYANYEPTSLGFRLRNNGNSSIVLADVSKGAEFSAGQYVVSQSDLPLWLLHTDDASMRQILIRQVNLGERITFQYISASDLR